MATEKIAIANASVKKAPRTKSTATSVSNNNAFRGDVTDIINSMRSGKVSRKVIPELAKRIGVEPDYLLEQLRLPKRAVTRRTPLDESLSSVEQDRIYRVERVLSRAQQVLEDATAVKTWLNHANRSLGGVTPLSLLDTEAGYELVLDTLGRIEYGVFS